MSQAASRTALLKFSGTLGIYRFCGEKLIFKILLLEKKIVILAQIDIFFFPFLQPPLIHTVLHSEIN